MSLREYARKRKFEQTPEPAGGTTPTAAQDRHSALTICRSREVVLRRRAPPSVQTTMSSIRAP